MPVMHDIRNGVQIYEYFFKYKNISLSVLYFL